jgi:hypothetical protein
MRGRRCNRKSDQAPAHARLKLFALPHKLHVAGSTRVVLGLASCELSQRAVGGKCYRRVDQLAAFSAALFEFQRYRPRPLGAGKSDQPPAEVVVRSSLVPPERRSTCRASVKFGIALGRCIDALPDQTDVRLVHNRRTDHGPAIDAWRSGCHKCLREWP